MPHRSSFAYTPQNSRPDALSALDPSANIDININTTYSIEPAPHRKPTFFTLCTALVYILILLAMCASFPLILIFTPQPELGEWSPGGIVCASCAEVEGMGVAEEALDVLGCRGWESTVSASG